MGKADNQPLPVAQQQLPGASAGRRCSAGVSKFVSFKCAAVLILSVAAFVLALFWGLPIRYGHLGFDAKESIKQSATVQAYFRLNKPVSKLIPYVNRLEYDLNEELGIPSAKVAVLSMHQEGKSNWTDVVFGFLPDPNNSKIDSVPLSLLKLTLIDLFLEQYNLTVDYLLFGNPSSFAILRFPGEITLIPEQADLILQSHPVLFHFTLNSSIYEIKENLLDLKKQLKLGLHLMPKEEVYIKLTNKNGSTVEPPVTVEASVVSDLGFLSLARLKQLAQTLTGSAKNLGLNHYVFGKVNGISLSSFLKHSLHGPTPTPSPSPAPSPEPIHGCGPSLEPSSLPPTSPGPSYPPKPSVPCGSVHPPRLAPIFHPNHMPRTVPSPASTVSPPAGSMPWILPSPSPVPGVTYTSRGEEKRSRKDKVDPRHGLSSFSSSWSSATQRIQWLNLIGGLLAVPLIYIP